MSILCLLFAEGLNHCCKDSSQEGFSMHQISRSHRRSVRRFRNTWLLSAQLCWLFLTDIPAQVFDSSMLLCQLCGALTHLFWMLFWFSTGEITIYIVQSTYLWDPGVEGIFLVFAMNNVTSISLHYLLLSAGTILPIVMVVSISTATLQRRGVYAWTNVHFYSRSILVDTRLTGRFCSSPLPPMTWTPSAEDVCQTFSQN